jgi:hypothetical protein
MKKSILNLSVILGFAVLSSGCIVHLKADGAEFAGSSIKLKESFEHDASDITTLFIDARAGDMRIRGVEGQTTINVDARIRTNESKSYELSIVNKGSTATLVAKNETSNWSGKSGYIDLTVTVPADILLDIKDTSGDMLISDVTTDIVIEDRSGDVRIKNTGGVKIDDRSGDLTIENANGDVTIDDRSGDINVSDASGDVVVSDRSGDISVRGANSLNVIDDGSGDVYHSDIAGAVITK